MATETTAARLADLYRTMPGMASVVHALAANGHVEFDQIGGRTEAACEADARYAIEDGIAVEVSREHRTVRGFMSSATLVIRVSATTLAAEVAALLAA